MEPQRWDVLAAGAGRVTSGYGYRRRMLISEEFLLLVTSPEGKWLAASDAVPLALAGGLLAELALRDHNEAHQASLRRQQVIKAIVEALIADVVADREQIARLVKQERKIHIGKFLTLACRLLQHLDALDCALRGNDDRLTELTEPVRCRRAVNPVGSRGSA